MPVDPRISLIQSASDAEREWQPEPEGFLAMHGYDEAAIARSDRAETAHGAPEAGRFRNLALAVEHTDGLYVWVLLESFDDVTGYEELARARNGDRTYASALHHGSRALHCLVADSDTGPRETISDFGS